MIVIAIIIYVLLNLAPKWILKKKYDLLENNFHWTIPLIKLTGLALSFCLAFLLHVGITKSTKDKYIENRNAIYGFQFNELMKGFGFQDSMRIMSIDGEEIERVSDIVSNLVLGSGEIKVSVEKNGIQNEIILSDADKVKLIQNHTSKPIIPIMYDKKGENELIVTIKNYTFSDVLDKFGVLWKQAVILITPNSTANKQMGGFVAISKINNFRGYLLVLSLNLIIVGILNFLPLPGFSIGNFIISIMETVRGKLYNKKRKRLIGLISLISVIATLLISMI